MWLCYWTIDVCLYTSSATLLQMRVPFLSSFSQKRLVGGALVLASMQFAASLAGLVRDRMLARTFPGLDTVDVYIASFRPSDLLFQTTIMAGFSVALVPLLATYYGKDKQQDMNGLLSGVTGIAAIVFGVLALLLAIFFPSIAPYLVRFEGESLQLYITFGRLALLTNFLFVFGNAFGQYLITIQKYWVYGLTPVLYTVGTIVGTVWLSSPNLFGQLGPMVGTLGGAVVYVLIRLGGVLWAGYRPALKFWHSDLPELLRLMLPRMMALGALQLQLLLFDTVASGLPDGALTINAYTRNFQAVAVGLAGIALAQSAFSPLSQAIARREVQRFWIYIRKGVSIILLVTIPGAIVLTFLAPVAAGLVGLSHRLPLFQTALLFYAISIPFESVNHLLLRSYYAMKNSVIPAIFAVSGGFLAIGLSWVLAREYGVMALPLGFTVGQFVQILGLGLLLPVSVKQALEPTPWFKNMINKFVQRH